MISELEYLMSALPEADGIMMDEAWIRRVVDHAAMVRGIVPWDIPEDIFRAFVLFPRVNNERPVFYQEILWKELWPRIKDKGMMDAALAVNLWCCERASYQSTDDRTADALAVLRRGFGRCGEESTLLTSALRSAGIPARQVYCPRWSHCDDNHAWVEFWADGGWHYMGACEPEPVPDSGWFTAAASKAMLVHIRSWGLLPEGERCEGRQGSAFILNRTAAYAQTRLLTVRVTRDGRPVPGAEVRFELANLGELVPICVKTTDEEGQTTLLTGLGTLHLHVRDGEKFVCQDVDVAESNFAWVRLEHDGAIPAFFRQRPPLETRIQPVHPSEEHDLILRECERLRRERQESLRSDDPDLARALGNRMEIQAFLQDERFLDADKRALLSMLTDKDCADVTRETLADALAGALAFRVSYPEKVWRESVLCPRVALEPLTPHRATLGASNIPGEGRALWDFLRGRVSLCEEEPPIPDPASVFRAGRGSAAALDILWVAAARAKGLAARLNPVTSEKEIWTEEGYAPLLPVERGKLALTEDSGQTLVYGVHFTIGRLESGAYRTLTLPGATLAGRMELTLPAGSYRVVTCARQIDGSVDGMCFPATVESGGVAEVAVRLQPDRTEDSLIRAALPPLKTREMTLPKGEGIAALLAPGQEPTEHFLNELLDAKDRLDGIPLYLILSDSDKAGDAKLQKVLATLKSARLLTEPDGAAILSWREILRAGDLRLPLAVALDGQGRGLFAFTNYNVGSVLSLLSVLEAGRSTEGQIEDL